MRELCVYVKSSHCDTFLYCILWPYEIWTRFFICFFLSWAHLDTTHRFSLAFWVWTCVHVCYNFSETAQSPHVNATHKNTHKWLLYFFFNIQTRARTPIHIYMEMLCIRFSITQRCSAYTALSRSLFPRSLFAHINWVWIFRTLARTKTRNIHTYTHAQSLSEQREKC